MSAWSDAVAALSPYLWWKLDETSGTTAADSSGNGLSGTYASATLNQSGLIAGEPTGKSVSLASTAALVSKTSGLSYNNVGVTYAMTFQSSTDFTSGRFFQGNSLSAFLGLGSTTMQATITVSQGGTFAYDPSNLCDGNPHLVIYVVKTTTAELWVDGTMVASITHAAVAATLTAFQVKQSSGNPLGKFDDALIFTSALSSTQLGTLWTGWQGIAAPVNVAGSLATETDTAPAGTARTGAKVTGAIATETDSAPAGSSTVAAKVTGAQAVETDQALTGALSFAQYVNGARADEVDTAPAGSTTAGAVLAGSLATETDTAGAGSSSVAQVAPGAIATETDSAPAGTPVTAPPVETDASNDAYKLTLGGWADVEWEPAIVQAPHTGIRHAVISAIAYGPVTMQGTQPVSTYSEADRPRLRQQIILGGRDITYDRGVPIPDVEYELADLLLYGPGTLALPQISASAEMGTDATERTGEGRRVKVRLIDDFTDPEHPTAVATVYKGFVLNPHVDGRHLELELGGEAQGRLTLRDSKVLFRDVLRISRLLWRELADVGVRFLPRLGEPDPGGTKTLNFGGVSKYEKVQELLTRDIKKDGTQRAILPDDQGIYRKIDKDTTTAHFSVFVDDAFTVASLDSDISEKPNSIYPTAIAPSGMRIDGAAVPGLVATPAPDYPMDDDSNLGIGTTNEDTDSGDGVSIMVNRLGAVGLLDIRDTPGGFDEDAADALAKLQRRAGLTGPVGVMTPPLWRALWDLDRTGRSPSWSTIQPTAQDTTVQRYLRSASGAPIDLNPDFDEDAIQVDESPDMGTGLTERQIDNFAETRVHHRGDKVWYGTITVHLGAVIEGQVDVGAILTPEILVDARLVKPGLHNLWVPNFDGGTLFGVSAARPAGEEALEFTVDNRFRPAREIWERRQVRAETRRDPSRRWLGSRQSTQTKDAVRGFISWGGVIDRDVPLVAGWNLIEVVVGDYGSLAQIRTVVQDVDSSGEDVVITGHEYALSLFGRPKDGAASMTDARLNALVPAPLTIAGEKAWRRRAVRKQLNAAGYLTAWGTENEPCGYDGDLKSDDAPLTGVEFDDAGVRFVGEHGYLVKLGVWVAEPTTLRAGRCMWPLLEGGV